MLCRLCPRWPDSKLEGSGHNTTQQLYSRVLFFFFLFFLLLKHFLRSVLILSWYEPPFDEQALSPLSAAFRAAGDVVQPMVAGPP